MADEMASEEHGGMRKIRIWLPLLLFLMESIRHLVCYGKRLAARRMDLGPIHDRAPAAAPSAYGLDLLERLAADLGPMRS